MALQAHHGCCWPQPTFDEVLQQLRAHFEAHAPGLAQLAADQLMAFFETDCALPPVTR